MKDSGVAWIGEIPEGWEVTIVKNLYNITLGKMLTPVNKTKDETLEKYLCAVNIGEDGLNLSEIKEMWFNDKDKEIYKLEVGDLLVVEGGNVGVCCQFMGEIKNCYIQNALHKVKPKSNQSNRFLYYWMKFVINTDYFNLISNQATIAHYTKEKFSTTPIIKLPFIIQQKISAFLDRKCAQIDAILSTIQQSIAKLKEYRQAVITQAVTKGLDPDAKMKDSGVEWIGVIPEEWSVTKIKNLYNITLGKMLASQQKSDDETLEKYLCAANIGENGLNLSEVKEMWFNKEEKRIYRLEVGDLLVVEGGNVGLCCQYMGELNNCYIQNALHKVTPKENQNNRYLYYWMKFITATDYLNLITNKATIAHYTKEKFSATPIVNVPLVVQQQIVVYLDQKTAQIDSLITEKQKLHDKFTAYKKSLIYEYVTGKREVPDDNAE